MESAIQKAALTKFGQNNNILVKIDRDTGNISIQKVLDVVETVEDPSREITPKDANSTSENKSETLKIGDKIYGPSPNRFWKNSSTKCKMMKINSKVKKLKKTDNTMILLINNINILNES